MLLCVITIQWLTFIWHIFHLYSVLLYLYCIIVICIQYFHIYIKFFVHLYSILFLFYCTCLRLYSIFRYLHSILRDLYLKFCISCNLSWFLWYIVSFLLHVSFFYAVFLDLYLITIVLYLMFSIYICKLLHLHPKLIDFYCIYCRISIHWHDNSYS